MMEAHEAAASVTRRQLVRAAASGSGTTAVGPAFVVAPNDRQAGTETNTETVTAEATVVAGSTPPDGDYTGQLIHVVGRPAEYGSAIADDRIHSDERQLRRYEAVLVEPTATDADTPASGGDRFVLAATPLPVGSVFVVERTRREVGRTHLRLEEVSASRTEPKRPTRERDATASATVDRCRTVAATGVATLSTLASVFAVAYAFGRRVGSR